MEFFDDPEESKLRLMQEYLRIWAWSQKERRRTGVNVLYPLMMSVRRIEKSEENVRRGLVLGQQVPVSRVERQQIAMKVDKIMSNSELWRGHYRDKEVLAMFYLDSSTNSRGCNEHERIFAKRLCLSRWQVKPILRPSLLFFFEALFGLTE